MKKFVTPFYLFTLILLSSCARESDSLPDTKKPVSNAKVAVRTLTALGEPPHRLPVHVYAFNTEGQCVMYQMLTNPDEQLSLTLSAGNYTISALTGALSDRYIIPDLSDALTSSPLALIDPASGHAELEAGRADITLDEGEHKELALTVSRVVALVKFSIFDLPENITEVKMSLQPLQSVLRLDGLFDDTQSGRTSVSLTKSDTGNCWTADSVFVFPGKANVTIGIVLKDTDGDHSYANNTSFEIKANYKYDIAATYKFGKPDINGIITGTDWEGEEVCEFVFGESAYRAGYFYRSCYILHVEKEASNKATLLLLSPKQWVTTDTIGVREDIRIRTYEYNGIENWEIPDVEAANKLHELSVQNIEQLNNLFGEYGHSLLKEDEKYLCIQGDDKSIVSFPIKGAFSTQNIVKGSEYRLRLVKKQQITYY